MSDKHSPADALSETESPDDFSFDEFDADDRLMEVELNTMEINSEIVSLKISVEELRSLITKLDMKLFERGDSNAI